jgi:diguanylate cyclase (GGDEF)-like protein/PAS domain S-box-containing protein
MAGELGGGPRVRQYRPHFLVVCVLAVVLLSGTHKALQNAVSDMRFEWFPRQASGDIVLVAIDPFSIEKIGVWPWPRSLHAKLIDTLEGAGASDIVFDVDFSSPSNPVADHALVDALQRAGGSVVLPSFAQVAADRGNGRTIHVNRPLPEFGKQAWSAVVNIAVEPDGLMRRYSFGETLDGTFLPSLGALLAGQYTGTEDSYLIDFSIRADSVPTVSYADVLRGDPATVNKLKNKKVIVGATAIELGDHFSVPNGHVIAGSLLQTLAAESILQGRTLRSSSSVVTLGGVGLIALLMGVMWRRHSAGRRVVVLLGSAVAIELGAMLVQAKLPIVIDTSLCLAAIAAYLAAMALDEIDLLGLLNMIAERRFQRIAMSLGDGLVCADRDSLITVWNPGAVAIFGREPQDMIGQPLDRIFAVRGGAEMCAAFSILDLPQDTLQVPGGKVMELKGRKKNGEVFPLEACFFGWHGAEGFQYGAVVRDISVRKREAERIRYLAEYDMLTGLANRNTLYEHLGARLGEAENNGRQVALLVMDVDKFKQINDTLGHACGDQVLCAVAKRLNALVEGAGLVARLGGDEFAILISGADVSSRAKTLSERTCLSFSNVPLSAGARQFRVEVSIGAAIYPDDCRTAEELLGNADLALYRAKSDGRGRHIFFDSAIRAALEARLSLEAELRQAVERDEFELFYQPQVSLEDGRLVGAEALIRWRHPARGLVLPADFMPVANASTLSGGIALWVIETACLQGHLWQQKGRGIRLGINLSPSQLQLGNLAATVEMVLRETGFSPSLLELEVTEDILLEDDDRARDIFCRIQALGVRIAFDDFGTGYASLTYLKKFPLDRLKIDKSFVRELRANSDDAAIVGTTINLTKLLGLSVIAEGIEDRTTADLLKSMGCEEGQGYYFGRPMPAAEFEQRFLSKDALPTSGTCATERAATAA